MYLLCCALLWNIFLGCLGGNCPSDTACTCSPHSIVCTNTGSEDSFKIEMLHGFPNLTDFKIHGFKQVQLTSDFLKQSQPNSVIFSNIEILIVDGQAFKIKHEMDYFEISNIGNLKASTWAFFPVNFIKKVLFQNVTAEQLKSNTIYGKNVGTLSIIGCDLGLLKAGAITMLNISKLNIENTRFGAASDYSLKVTGIENSGSKLAFRNVSFGECMTDAYRFSNLSLVNYSDCTFEKVHSEFIVSHDIEDFVFLDNHFKECTTGSFYGLNATILSLKNNFFAEIQDKSLPFNSQLNMIFEDNVFTCNCGLSWIWNSSLSESILQNNFCYKTRNTKEPLSALAPTDNSGEDKLCVNPSSIFVPVKLEHENNGETDTETYDNKNDTSLVNTKDTTYVNTNDTSVVNSNDTTFVDIDDTTYDHANNSTQLNSTDFGLDKDFEIGRAASEHKGPSNAEKSFPNLTLTIISLFFAASLKSFRTEN